MFNIDNSNNFMVIKKIFILILFNCLLLSNKSTLDPVLKSAVLPGLGQLELGEKKRSKVFILVECTLLATCLGSYYFSNKQIKNYKSFSAYHAGVDIRNKNHKYWVDIGNYLSLENHNAEHLRWRQINEIYDVDNNWIWESEKHMNKFEKMRIRSDKFAKYGEYTLGIITLNHIVSSINSLYLSRLTDSFKIYSFIEKKDIRIQLHYDF